MHVNILCHKIPIHIKWILTLCRCTSICVQYMAHSLTVHKKANKIRTYRMGEEMNRRAPLFFVYFANFLLLICSVVTFIHLPYIYSIYSRYIQKWFCTVFGSSAPFFHSFCSSILTHSIQLNSPLPYIFIRRFSLLLRTVWWNRKIFRAELFGRREHGAGADADVCG